MLPGEARSGQAPTIAAAFARVMEASLPDIAGRRKVPREAVWTCVIRQVSHVCRTLYAEGAH